MKWRNRSPLLADELSRLRALAPYELLSVPADASVDAIKAAYRAMAMVYHPDRSDQFMRRHNEQVMKLINAAYERLVAERAGAQDGSV